MSNEKSASSIESSSSEEEHAIEELDLSLVSVNGGSGDTIIAPPSRAGVIIGDRYRLDGCLGSGAMGEVWRAIDRMGGENVAIKLIKEDKNDREFQARFHREARVLSRIRHPNVLEVRDYGTDPRPYLVMELLVGEDLAALIDRERRLPLARVNDLIAQLCAGLMHVHAEGVVHRDIKPANVFCVQGGEYKLVDFGLAKRVSPLVRSVSELSEMPTLEVELTRQDIVLGTMKYMSPEQMSRREVDFRSDLWSTAVLIFKALTGRTAFHGATDVDTMLEVLRGPTPVPSRDVADLPPKLDNFFLRALQKNPDHRFGSAAEMADAFGRIVAGASRRPQGAPRP